jgi:hypothetical protein
MRDIRTVPCEKCAMFASESIRSQVKNDLIPRMDALPGFEATLARHDGDSEVS